MRDAQQVASKRGQPFEQLASEIAAVRAVATSWVLTNPITLQSYMENVCQDNGCSSGQSTPTPGALRRDLLAVLISNPLFTKEEQLLANHQAHECDCPLRLALWLRNVSREATRRQRAARAQALASKQAVDCPLETLTDELYQLSECPALRNSEKQGILLLAPPTSKLEAVNLVGQFYVKALLRNGLLTEN